MSVGIFIHRAQRGNRHKCITLSIKCIDKAIDNVIDPRQFQLFLVACSLIHFHEMIGFRFSNFSQIQTGKLCGVPVFIADLNLSKMDIFTTFNFHLFVWRFAEKVDQPKQFFCVNSGLYLEVADAVSPQGVQQSLNRQISRHRFIGKDQLFINNFEGDVTIDVK